MNRKHPAIAVFIWLVATTLILTLSVPPAHGYDFEQAINPNRSTSNRNAPSLDNRITRLKSWERQPAFLEIGMIRDTPLWVFADTTVINVTLGIRKKLFPGRYKKTMPGQIYHLDVHPMNHRPNMNLLAVFHRNGSKLQSTLYEITRAPSRLTIQRILRRDFRLIRPLDNFLYQQGYDFSIIWRDQFHRLRTGNNNPQMGKEINLAWRPRLYSLAKQGRTWAGMDVEGNIHVQSTAGRHSMFEGSFGWTPQSLEARTDSREGVPKEPFRIPPVFIGNGTRVAAIYNPPRGSGVQQFFQRSGGGSEILLFDIGGRSLIHQSSLGPFSGEILDITVPPLNPNQLLWLRKNQVGKTVLEMIDFSEK